MTERTWVDVGPIAEMKFMPGHRVKVDKREIGIFVHEGRYFALDNTCPHAGGPLSEGAQDGDKISCLWHSWEFELDTGKCVIGGADTGCYPVREVEGRLEVEV